jgi:hypothetical protein
MAARGRRARRKLHLGVDAESGQIVTSALTTKEIDDGVGVGPLLDQLTGSLSSFTADGAYDQDGVYAAVAERHPETAVIVPPRSTAVLSDKAATAPTERVTSSASPRAAAWLGRKLLAITGAQRSRRRSGDGSR